MSSPPHDKLNSCFNSIPNTNPIKIIHAPQKISIMHFLERIHYCLSTHKVINWIISILFFLIFTLNSISRIFLTGRRLDSKFFKRDLIFFLCGMRPEVLVPEDIVMALSISIITSITILLFFLFAFAIKKRYYPLFMNLFVGVWFYIVPLIIYLNINVFMQGYALVDYISDQQRNRQYGFTPIIFAAMIFHIITIFLCAISFPLFSETPRDIVHPFISISRLNSLILLPYFFIFMHISGFFYEFNLTRFAFRIILAVVVLIVHLYSPFYSHRVMNSMLLFVLLSEIVCTSVYVSMNDLDSTYNIKNYNLNDDNAFMDKRFTIILFSLLPNLVISFIYFFLIFQHISKNDRFHQIKNQFISGETAKTKILLRRLKFVNIQHCNMKEIIKIAISLKYPQTNQIIQYLATSDKYTKSIIDIYYLWTSINIIDLEINNGISLPMLKMADKYDNKIKELEKEFWTNVYLSNISKLPKIASKLNLVYGLRYLNINDASKLCQKLLKSDNVNAGLVQEIKSSRKISSIKKYLYKCSMFDVFIAIVFIAIVIGHSLFLVTSKQRWNLINNCIAFIHFLKDFMDYEVTLWSYYDENGMIQNKINLTISNYSLNKVINCFNELKKMKEKEKTIAALLDTSLTGKSFEENFDYLINTLKPFYNNSQEILNDENNNNSIAFSDDNFSISITNLFIKIVYEFDNILVSMHTIFNDIVKSKIKYKSMFSFFAPTALIIIFIIVVIVNFIILKKKCRQFYKGFAIIRKPVLKKYETEPSKGTYQFRRKHTFAYISTYPATTISIALAFLNVCFQLFLLKLNENHDRDNAELIDTTVNGLAQVQAVPLWLVTSILFRNTTFNSYSSSAIDFLSMSSKLKEYKYLIPNKIFTLYGDYVYRNNQKILFNEWFQFYEEIEANVKAKSETFDYLVGFFCRRFTAFFICSFIIFIFFMIIQSKIDFFIKGEIRTGEYILKQFVFNFSQQQNQQKKKRKKSYISNDDNLNEMDKIRKRQKIEDSSDENSNLMKIHKIEDDTDESMKPKKMYKIEDDNTDENMKPKQMFKIKDDLSNNKKLKQKKKNKNKHNEKSDDELSLEEIYYDENDNDNINENKSNVDNLDFNLEQPVKSKQKNKNVSEVDYRLIEREANKKEKTKYWPFIIESFDQSLMPLDFIVVNPKLKVVFCTKKSYHKVGQTIKQGRLSQFLNKKMKELNKKCKVDEEVVWKMPDTNIQAIPMLKFNDKENKFEVNYLIVLSIEDSDFRVDKYQNEYNVLFKLVYPEFMKEATFPAQISTKQNYRMVLLIKLVGFDEDFMKNNNAQKKLSQNNLNLNLATIRIRRLISQSLAQKLNEYPFIYRIRETSSEIIITFDQENDKIAWNLFQFGSTIANSVFSDLKLLKSSLITRINDNNNITELPFAATALLYKAKVQDMYVADEKMGFVDFVGDCIYEAEKILKFCIPFHFNYVSIIPRDPKPKFTTKIKSFTIHESGNEMKYDLYIGV